MDIVFKDVFKLFSIYRFALLIVLIYLSFITNIYLIYLFLIYNLFDYLIMYVDYYYDNISNKFKLYLLSIVELIHVLLAVFIFIYYISNVKRVILIDYTDQFVISVTLLIVLEVLSLYLIVRYLRKCDGIFVYDLYVEFIFFILVLLSLIFNNYISSISLLNILTLIISLFFINQNTKSLGIATKKILNNEFQITDVKEFEGKINFIKGINNVNILRIMSYRGINDVIILSVHVYDTDSNKGYIKREIYRIAKKYDFINVIVFFNR